MKKINARKILALMALVLLAGCADTNLSETASGHVMINAPVQTVFEYVTADQTKWDPNLKELTDREGQGFGATSKWVYEVAGQQYKGESTVVEYVLNRKLVSKSSGEIDSTWTWLFVPRGDKTKLVLIIDYSLKIPKAAGMARDALGEKLNAQIEPALAEIKKQMEQP